MCILMYVPCILYSPDQQMHMCCAFVGLDNKNVDIYIYNAIPPHIIEAKKQKCCTNKRCW